MSTAADRQARSDSLKRQFLDRAKSLANLAEVYRSSLVTELLTEALASGLRIETEIFQEAYGNLAERYWHGLLSEPIQVAKLAYVLSLDGAESAERFEWEKIATVLAFRDAAEAGQEFFIGDTKPLLALRDGQSDFAGLGKLKVRPRAAVSWLLSKPKRNHLVPEMLRGFLQLDKSSSNWRHLTETNVECFVVDYINDEQREGRRPTIEGLEAAAKAAGMRGGRELLRAIFNQYMGGRRGRPAKAPAKSAKN